jgi:hypothetical protein
MPGFATAAFAFLFQESFASFNLSQLPFFTQTKVVNER